jgi:hypothetical protein
MGYFVEHYFAKQGCDNHVMGRLQLRYIHPRGQTYKGRNDMGAHILGAKQPRGLTNKGRNIQEFPVRDSPVRDAITLHPLQGKRKYIENVSERKVPKNISEVFSYRGKWVRYIQNVPERKVPKNIFLVRHFLIGTHRVWYTMLNRNMPMISF